MRDKIFYEEFVIESFCEVEKAHKGQVDGIMKLTLFCACLFWIWKVKGVILMCVFCFFIDAG